MPRSKRIIEHHHYYHIISRSINQMLIFKDNQDFEHMKDLMVLAKRRYPFRLYYYVLMQTHFHFVIQTIDATQVPKHLSYVKWNYTKWFRKKYSWEGPIWRERYRSIDVEDENHLETLGNYIEHNPVRAGLCLKPDDYLHSSYHHYHLNKNDLLIDPWEG